MHQRSAVVPPHQVELAENYHHSPAVLVGDTLYAAGQIGLRADGTLLSDPTLQTVAAFENVKSVLAHAGFTFADVVELVTYHMSFADSDLFASIKDRYFLGPVFPAWTAVQVAGLAFPDAIVEIKCTAVRQ